MFISVIPFVADIFHSYYLFKLLYTKYLTQT